MDSSTFLLFLIIMGLAFMSNNQTLMIMGVGVGVIFIAMMGGAHHIIIAIVAIVILYLGFQASQSGDSQYMLYALFGAGLIFIIFVMHGKEQPEGGGMDPYGMGMMAPPGY